MIRGFLLSLFGAIALAEAIVFGFGITDEGACFLIGMGLGVVGAPVGMAWGSERWG